MLPTFHLGVWQFRTYGVLLSLVALVIGMYGFHRLRRLGLPTALLLQAGVPVLVSGFAAALLAVYLPRLLHTGALGQGGGMTISWGAAGAISVAVISCWRYRLPLGRAFDLGVLACPLGQAIGRLGCLAAGCCAGKVTTSGLGMYLPGAGGVWAVRYPTQLLDAAAHLLIFLALLAVERRGRQPFDGFLFVLYLALSSAVRFGMGFLREEAIPVTGPLSAMHLQGIAGLAIAMALILWNMGRSPARILTARQ